MWMTRTPCSIGSDGDSGGTQFSQVVLCGGGRRLIGVREVAETSIVVFCAFMLQANICRKETSVSDVRYERSRIKAQQHRTSVPHLDCRMNLGCRRRCSDRVYDWYSSCDRYDTRVDYVVVVGIGSPCCSKSYRNWAS